MGKDENEEAVELLWSITEKLDKVLEQLVRLNLQLTGGADAPIPAASPVVPPAFEG